MTNADISLIMTCDVTNLPTIYYLNMSLCLLSFLVILSLEFNIILILLTVHIFMDCLTDQTVNLPTRWTMECIHSVFKNAPKNVRNNNYICPLLQTNSKFDTL